MTEIFEVKTGIAKRLIKGVFEFADVPHNLRNQSKCSRSIPCTEKYGIQAASSIGPKLWDKVPTEIKNSKSLEEFKARIIISWVPKNCPSKICKLFIKHVGYLNYERLFMFHFTILLVIMKISNLISLFPVIEIPIMAQHYYLLFVHILFFLQ